MMKLRKINKNDLDNLVEKTIYDGDGNSYYVSYRDDREFDLSIFVLVSSDNKKYMRHEIPHNKIFRFFIKESLPQLKDLKPGNKFELEEGGELYTLLNNLQCHDESFNVLVIPGPLDREVIPC